jgi:hypothetical protein
MEREPDKGNGASDKPGAVHSIPTGLAKAGGTGAKGGDGGSGGAGGSGGGGGGGPTVGIVEDRLSQSSRSGNTFYLGAPGAGGVSRGVVPTKGGNRGADGLRAEFAKFAGTGAGAAAMFLELELPPGAEMPRPAGGPALPE